MVTSESRLCTFRTGVKARNTLYDRGVFKIHKLARPVVSVGNISVGGTGKTPFVIALGELLKQRGIAFDILSRGYGRSSTSIAVVDPNGSRSQFGDEPLLLARKLGVPVIVGADRYQAGLLAEQQFASSLHLFDDGFQHRRLHRDFDIVLLPAADMQTRCFPSGVCVSHSLPCCARMRWRCLTCSIYQPLHVKKAWQVRRQLELSHPSGKLIAFCGIGRPKQFFDGLKTAGQELASEVVFRDHYSYGQRDLDRLLELKTRTGAEDLSPRKKMLSI